jgi:hypothetical protein
MGNVLDLQMLRTASSKARRFSCSWLVSVMWTKTFPGTPARTGSTMAA